MCKMKLIVISLLMVFAFTNCNNDDMDINTTPMDINVDGYVFDEVGNPIEGAVVSGVFGETKTNDEGNYSINGLDMGSYRFVIEIEGYMTKAITEEFIASEDEFKGNVLNIAFETTMYKADQPISTQMIKTVGPTTQVLPDMPYTIRLDADYLERYIYGTSDANGMITATLPNDFFVIIVDTVIGEVSYSAYDEFYSTDNVDQTLTVYCSDVNASPFYMVSTNLVDEDGDYISFDPSQDITLGYNVALDTEASKFTLSKVVDGYTYDVNVEVAFTDGDKVVSISVFDGDFEAGQGYYLEAKAISSDDESSINNGFSFVTIGDVITSLDAPKYETFKLRTDIGDYTSRINFDITIDNNSSSIEIYGRYNNDEDFVKLPNYFSFYWLDLANGIIQLSDVYLTYLPGITVPSAGLFSDNNDFEIMVRTYVESDGEIIYSDFSDIIVLEEGDLAVVD